MPSPTNRNIERYVDYFRGVLLTAARMRSIEGRSTPALRQILYFCCLDTWAGDAFPKNDRRFVRFLDEIVNWNHRDRINAFLTKIILEEKELMGSPLYAQITDLLGKLPSTRRLTADDDPRASDLKYKSDEDSIVTQNRYDHLLWKYRNLLLHEFVIPGKVYVELELTVPYYIKLPVNGSANTEDGSNDKECTHELVLSCCFFHHLCENALEAYRVWLIDNERDPYRNAELKTSWR